MRSFEAVSFAGGGNRCHWQSGFWETFTAAHRQAPRVVVAVSGGALQACIAFAGVGAHARAQVIAACDRDIPTLDLRRMLAGRSPFVVGDLYRALLEATFGADQLAALRAAPEILIQVAHPPRLMPGYVAGLAAIAAYQLEKALTGAAHSKAGRALGLTPAWISTHALESPPQLVEALMATSAVPPFMPLGRVAGRAALDGGLVDNPPLDRLGAIEAAGGRTLVLTTRTSATALPSGPNRVVARPSAPIAVGKFAVNDGAGISAAYALGLRDGAAYARLYAAGEATPRNPVANT